MRLTQGGHSRLAEAHGTHVGGIRRYFSDRLEAEELRVLTKAWWRLSSALEAPEQHKD